MAGLPQVDWRLRIAADVVRERYGMDAEIASLLCRLLAARQSLEGRTPEWIADEVWARTQLIGAVYDTTEVGEYVCQRRPAPQQVRRYHPS